jgi:hypothetical protein
MSNSEVNASSGCGPVVCLRARAKIVYSFVPTWCRHLQGFAMLLSRRQFLRLAAGSATLPAVSRLLFHSQQEVRRT